MTAEDDSDLSLGNVSDARSNGALNETVREEDVFGSRNSPQNSNSNQETVAESEEANKPCPKCGYPLRPGTEKCPHCK